MYSHTGHPISTGAYIYTNFAAAFVVLTLGRRLHWISCLRAGKGPELCTSYIPSPTTNSFTIHAAILHPKSLTNNILPEFWFRLKIFLQAFTDTGLTGCSLSCAPQCSARSRPAPNHYSLRYGANISFCVNPRHNPCSFAQSAASLH